MSQINEHDQIVLTQDLPDARFKAGDVGTVVLIHQGGAGYEVEFFTLGGDTVDVATVNATQVRPTDESDIVHARRLAG